MPDGTEYPPKETDQKLVELVGLTKSQFMQVAMIAQGEFMELLRAKSDEKKVIFRKLFHTEIYEKIVEELGKRRKEKLKEAEQLQTKCRMETSHVMIPGEYEKAEELLQWKSRLLEASRFSVVDAEQFLKGLEELCHGCPPASDKISGAGRGGTIAAGMGEQKKGDGAVGAP